MKAHLKSGLLPVFLLLMITLPDLGMGQDRLLMTNGKVRELKGEVVYYDNEVILCQNERQQERMKAFIAKREKKRKELESSERWKRKQAKQAAKKARKEEKRKQRLLKRQKAFEQDVTEKMENLSPADFERWKNKELDRLKRLKKQQELEAELERMAEETTRQRKETRRKLRFTKRIPRDMVFSILKPDSTEIVVYNPDTLGFFMDGSAEVEYGVSEMRSYIRGRQDGRKHRTGFDAGIGAAIGIISSSLGTYWGPSIPAGYIVVTSIANTKVQNKAGVEPSLLDNQAYRDGYERSAKRKKTWDFVKGSVAGLGFGMIVGHAIFGARQLPAPR